MDMNTKLSELACRQYEALLEDYIGGRLDVGGAKMVSEHLEGCDDCRNAFEASMEGAHLFSVAGFTLDRDAAPSPAFSRTVMARIGVEKARHTAERLSYWQPFVSFAWRFAATAMLALMLLLTYAVRGRGRAREILGPIGQQSAVVDVFSPDPTATPANQDEVLIMVAESEHAGH